MMNPSEKPIEIKHALYESVAKVSKALGQQTRLEIIEILAQAPRNVEAVARILKLEIKSVSQHLKVLEENGLVSARREGRYRWYSVSCREVVELAVHLRRTAQKLYDIESPAQTGDRLTLRDALTLSQSGELLLIDVRPKVEFDAGHLPNAMSLPLEELEKTIGTLPWEKPAAAYCRSNYCFLVKQAQAIFADHGRRLLLVEDGVEDWLADAPYVLTTK